MAHHTGNPEGIKFGQNVIDEADLIIESGSDQLHETPHNVIEYHEGADNNIADGWVATEENP